MDIYLFRSAVDDMRTGFGIDSEYPVRVYDENEQEIYGQVSEAEKFDDWQQIGAELDKLETKGLIIRNNYYVANSIEPEEPIFRDVQLR